MNSKKNHITFASALAWNTMIKLLIKLDAFPSKNYHWIESDNHFGLELHL